MRWANTTDEADYDIDDRNSSILRSLLAGLMTSLVTGVFVSLMN